MSRVALGLVLACALGAPAAGGSDVRKIDAAELHSMVVDNAYGREAGRHEQFVIVDARSKEAYAKAHVFSAISVPEAEFAASADRLPKDRSTLVVVYGGAAGRWAQKAMAAGYDNVAFYFEDFARWKERGMPIAPLQEIP